MYVLRLILVILKKYHEAELCSANTYGFVSVSLAFALYRPYLLTDLDKTWQRDTLDPKEHPY